MRKEVPQTWRTETILKILNGINKALTIVKASVSLEQSLFYFSTSRKKSMNKIIRKLQIPGYQTKVIVNPRKNKSSIVADVVQLSLDFNKDEKRDSEN